MPSHTCLYKRKAEQYPHQRGRRGYRGGNEDWSDVATSQGLPAARGDSSGFPQQPLKGTPHNISVLTSQDSVWIFWPLDSERINVCCFNH